MSAAPTWADRVFRSLLDAGVPSAEATVLVQDSVDDAASSGAAPEALFGPASAYALTLAQTLRTAHAGISPLPRERGPVVLRLVGVAKSYRRRAVLHGVDLTLRAGEVAAVVGANGSGKTTLLNICAGLDRASSGTVERTQRVGFAPQERGVAELLTAEEHFRLFGAVHGMESARSVAVGTQLASRLGWRPKQHITAGRLSGGTQQKLNVVLSELDRPELMLLDEPYQGFDQESYVDLWDQIYQWRDAGAGILVVTHMLRDLDRVDHVVELHPSEDS